MGEYYVVRDKNTGLYFRGKGVNRWGKYYNQASIYRIRANAENTIKEVSWMGEQAEVVPIQIFENTADVVKVKYGEWNLEIKSFYADNWDESIELIIYILATCPYCGEAHSPKQVFSKSLYPPEDATEDFRFNQAYEKGKVLAEFRQKNYKFQNYCPNCGAKMDGGKVK